MQSGLLLLVQSGSQLYGQQVRPLLALLPRVRGVLLLALLERGRALTGCGW